MITDVFKTSDDIEKYIARREEHETVAMRARLNEERKRLIRELAEATVSTPILDYVLRNYPNDIKRENRSLSGRIPMYAFERMEPELRKEMRKRGLRVWYYGTRKANPRSATTRRDEATHVMIYDK